MGEEDASMDADSKLDDREACRGAVDRDDMASKDLVDRFHLPLTIDTKVAAGNCLWAGVL